LPDDDYGQTARASYSNINKLVLMQAINTSSGTTADNSFSLNCSPSSAQSLATVDRDEKDGILGSINGYFSRCLSSVIESGTEIMMGTSTDVDAIMRIKATGDFFATVSGLTSGLQIATNVGLFATRTASGTAATLTSVVYDFRTFSLALFDFVTNVVLEPLAFIEQFSDLFSFYFGVFLPSLPYTIFIIAVVGFFVAVLQSVIASSLWAVMHMTPDRTFIGSQSQGYLLLLSLFVRPSLLTIGLFAAFQMINPIVAFSSKAFWSMRAANIEHENFIAQFAQWKNWVIVYGMMLLPIVYMVFGLSASLADEVLTWVGHGVKPLGQTEAMSQMQQRSERHGRDIGGDGKGGGKPPPSPNSRAPKAAGDGGGGGKGDQPATGGNTQAPAPVPTVASSLSDS
jgi:conjugal transfer/type IV secretion protein DotA/TraY